MRGRVEDQVLFLHQDDVPQYKKKSSVVRNSYFWALRSIAGRSGFDRDWEYESEVWFALQRMLQSEGTKPTYTLVDARGPDHQKEFQVELLVDGQVVSQGLGRSKKEAEQNAAQAALRARTAASA